MIIKSPSTQAGHVHVVFELPSCVWADRIHLVGEFNGWNETTLPMRQGRDGVWRAELDLPMGQSYQFRYIVDGHWQTDYHADGHTDNQYGTHNSIVCAELPEKRLEWAVSSSQVRERSGTVNPRTARPLSVVAKQNLELQAARYGRTGHAA